jgi:hypothetical protein
MSDPLKRQIRCPECGKLTPLDADGRFVTHLPPGDATRGWCKMAGGWSWGESWSNKGEWRRGMTG